MATAKKKTNVNKKVVKKLSPADKKKAELKKLSDQYMKLTAKRRIFKSVDVAEKAINAAKMKVPTRAQVAADTKARLAKKRPAGSTGARAHHKVKVGKEIFGSVYKAFVALKLPVKKHVKFRGELKAAGKLAFKDGKKTYNFSLV